MPRSLEIMCDLSETLHNQTALILQQRHKRSLVSSDMNMKSIEYNS